MKGGLNMEKQDSETITIRKDTLWKYSTFVLLGVVILGVLFFFLGDKSTTGNVIQQPGDLLPSEPTAKIEVNTDGDPVKGDGNAPVAFVEFTDYECPFCQRHFMQTGSAIDARVQAGDVKLITKDYPLPFHAQAQKAAESAHCARDQGGDEAYYEMHDLLFSSVEGGETTFKEYAKQIGLDANKFATCLSSDKFADEVAADLAYGSQIGVQGTPAFFINGRMISGACPAQTFTSAIDAEIDGNDWAVTNCQFVEL